jgi:hypothetical protein
VRLCSSAASKECPRVENLDAGQIAAGLSTAKAAIQGMVAHLPTHEEFLRGQVGQSI